LLIQRAGIHIVALHACSNGSALVDHPAEMHIPRQAFSNTPRVFNT
jgi:hypothetical protein